MYIEPPLQAAVIIVSKKQAEKPINSVYVGNVKDKPFSWFIFFQNVYVAKDLPGKIDVNKYNYGGNIHLGIL